MENILVQNENFFYIIYASHSKNMCTKYGRSRMNDAHTMSTADLVGLPAKVVRPIAFFLNSESIFVRLLHWPSAGRPAGGHMCNGIPILFINLKQININGYHY